jgi:SagB-type dehydrogenase family enzyme
MKPSANFDAAAMRDYHERTKHSVARLQANRHYLDWDIQPRPFKLYKGLSPMALPRPAAGSGVSALDALSRCGYGEETSAAIVPDIQQLARLLYFSAGITKTKVYPGGHEHHFRAAACTGALYHIDLYLVCGPLPDLEAGVYHFGPHDFALRRLRAGDFRAAVAEATADLGAALHAPATLVFTSTFWRNAWKYQSRAYRHCFWDNGTILANLFAVAAADGLPVRLVLGFADATINALLGLDTDREVALSLVTLGHRPDDQLPPAPTLTPLAIETEPLSRAEVDYPAIRAAHSASSLGSPAEVRAWRDRAIDSRPDSPPLRQRATGEEHLLLPESAPAALSIERAILRRGSTRRFARAPISSAQLSAMLKHATGGVAADYTCGDPPLLLPDVYLIVNAVDALPSGTYVHHRERNALELLAKGDFRRQAGFLDLGQELAADAAVNFYLLADLEPLFRGLGNRAYRAAQLDAAIVGGRIYLAAYALGLGATGLTFFDDDVTDFFSPHAAGKSVMFLVAAGVPGR